MLGPSRVTSDAPDPSSSSAIDALYQGPRAAFVESRNRLAAQLQLQGRSALASEVRGLPKPSVSAWAVNQLWWKHRAEYDALHAAGAALVERQQRGEPIAGQPENEARRAALDTLRALAAELLRAAGHAASVGTLRKVSQSLEASAAGGSFGSHARLGRLHTELSPPGFGQLARFSAVVEPASNSSRYREAAARRTAAELEFARATRELEDALTVREAAGVSMDDARAALERARRTVQESEEALTRAQARVEVARARDRSARAALDEAEQAEAAAESESPPEDEDL